jgi:hypothetical protein
VTDSSLLSSHTARERHQIQEGNAMNAGRGRAGLAAAIVMSLAVGSVARSQAQKGTAPDSGAAEQVMRLTPAEIT